MSPGSAPSRSFWPQYIQNAGSPPASASARLRLQRGQVNGIDGPRGTDEWEFAGGSGRLSGRGRETQAAGAGDSSCRSCEYYLPRKARALAAYSPDASLL